MALGEVQLIQVIVEGPHPAGRGTGGVHDLDLRVRFLGAGGGDHVHLGGVIAQAQRMERFGPAPLRPG